MWKFKTGVFWDFSCQWVSYRRLFYYSLQVYFRRGGYNYSWHQWAIIYNKLLKSSISKKQWWGGVPIFVACFPTIDSRCLFINSKHLNTYQQWCLKYGEDLAQVETVDLLYTFILGWWL